MTCRFLYLFFLMIYQGLTRYNNSLAVISDSVFHPKQLTENKMLYFWLSGQSFFLTRGHFGTCCVATFTFRSRSLYVHLEYRNFLSFVSWAVDLHSHCKQTAPRSTRKRMKTHILEQTIWGNEHYAQTYLCYFIEDWSLTSRPVF